MCILSQFCFNAKLFRETLEPVALTVRFMASAVMMWPIFYSDTVFKFRPREIQQIVCQVVAYRRFKTIENFKQSSLKVVPCKRWSLMRGGRLRVVPSIVI